MPPRRDLIEVSGSLFEDATWNADLVRVLGDITVEDGVTLTVAAGTRVEFTDYYRLTVAGTLVAVGTPAARIVFTTDDPQDFAVDASWDGCWNGIRFDGTSPVNAPSRLAYCTLEYSKAVGATGGSHPYGGGAVSATGCAGVTVENCILRHNVADYGGAVFLYEQANVTLVGNLIAGNHALQNASAVYCAYSYPVLAHNTIVENPIHNTLNPYVETCAILNFLGKPRLANNIVRDNTPDVVYLHGQLWSAKDWYTRHNNIEAGAAGVGHNIDADPRFLAPGLGDYRLAPGSPCIDAGLVAALPADELDLDGDGDTAESLPLDLNGDPRRVDDGGTPDCWPSPGDCGPAPLPDMGAHERPPALPGDLDGDFDVDAADLEVFGACLAGPHMASPPGCSAADLDGDDDADLADFAVLQTLADAPAGP